MGHEQNSAKTFDSFLIVAKTTHAVESITRWGGGGQLSKDIIIWFKTRSEDKFPLELREINKFHEMRRYCNVLRS